MRDERTTERIESMTITEFLLARIEEDERDATMLRRQWEECPPSAYEAAQVGALGAGDPERVLAECRAKRRIVEMHPPRWQEVEHQRKMGGKEAKVERVAGPFYDDEVRALASVYSDHPDYDATWRLTT